MTLFTSQSHATGYSEKARLAFVEKIENKTLWSTDNLNRIYFAKNGVFKQQINDLWGDMPLGTVLTGQWAINAIGLCWSYDTKTRRKHYIPQGMHCYKTTMYSDDKKGLKSTQLHSILNGKVSDQISFEWDTTKSGNHIMHPDFVLVLYEEMKRMNEYVDNNAINASEAKDHHIECNLDAKPEAICAFTPAKGTALLVSTQKTITFDLNGSSTFKN